MLIKRLARKANVEERWNPHAWRHGFAREWLMSEGDMASLQDSLGHSDIQVTKMYSPYTLPDLQKKHQLHSPIARLFRRVVKGLKETEPLVENQWLRVRFAKRVEI